jgi:GDP-4-dehydro-6-deoxy-D-mannose reductase
MSSQSIVVVSGINGFVGRHLALELKKNGATVIGIGQDKFIHPDLVNVVSKYYPANLVEEWPTIPDAKAIIHLAGLSSVVPSFSQPQAYINSNSAMVTNLCEYYLAQTSKPRIIIISSGAVYDSNQSMPISESSKISFTSPYIISKILNENQAAYYRHRGLDCVVVRPFNHIGPGQNLGFILPDFYNRLINLKPDETKIITGNINTRRDYTDVRDVVRAYTSLALVETLEHDTYNICSGVSLSGLEILNELKQIMGLPEVSFEIDQSLVRPTDIQNIVGDSSRLQKETGWKPQISIRQTISDFIKWANSQK